MNISKAIEELQLINGDVFKEIKKIPSNSIHLICTDPPYFISRNTNFHKGGGNQKKYGSISMNFGEWDLDRDQFDWFSLLNEFKRILVPGGTMVIFYDSFKMSDIVSVAEKINLQHRRIGRWDKTNPAPLNMKINYLSNASEYFISYTKGTKKTFNSSNNPAIYVAPRVSGKVKIHRCQKPVSVLQQIIETHTNEGETVLDGFMGSGSTGQAALNLNRKFIGIELDQTHFNDASMALLNRMAKDR